MVLLSLLKSAARASTFVKYFNLSMEQTAIGVFPENLSKIAFANNPPTTKKTGSVKSSINNGSLD
jgi:hypothetical protein